jgi:hypothetical protein
MNSSELHRKLLYCGYGDLTDYLKNSPLNRYIYKKLLELKSERRFDQPILTIFNEVYYQCASVQIDETPGENISERYFDKEERWLKSRTDSYYVFLLVWVILSLKKQLNFHEECFMEHLTPLLSYMSDKYLFQNMLEELKSQGINAPEQFVTISAPVEDLPHFDEGDFFEKLFIRLLPALMTVEEREELESNPWRQVTNNFSPNYIEYYFNLYSSEIDRHLLLWRIKEACSRKERRNLKDFFEKLESKTTSDDLPQMKLSFENEVRQNKKIAEQQQLISQLEQQLQAQKVDYELQLARMAAQNRPHSEQQETSQVKNLSSNDTAKKEPSLTISEMAAHVKERFSKQAAEEFCTMFYHFAVTHDSLDEASAKLIDGIVPAILQRDKPHQTLDFPNVTQFNNNPQTVINHGNKD